MATLLENELLQYLPEVFREDNATRDFLLAFEKILLGRADNIEIEPNLKQPGLEQTLEQLARYFTPLNDAGASTDDEFLPWLSQWVALSLRTDVFDSSIQDYKHKNIEVLRKFIAEIPDLYKIRGTNKSLRQLLEIFTSVPADQIKVIDQIDGKPHFFKVRVKLYARHTTNHENRFDRAKELAHSVIRLEKPAHTHYQLIPSISAMRIGRRNPPSPGPTAYFIKIGEDNMFIGDLHDGGKIPTT